MPTTTNPGQLIYDFGFIGNGSNTLATVDPSKTLSQWQVIYPASATTGSAGALSLSDEIDGLAIQKAIDVQAASGRVEIDLPACFAYCTYPLKSNGNVILSIRGFGGFTSGLYYPTSRAFEFGQTTAHGNINLDGVFIRGNFNGYAILLNSAGDPSIFMKNCMVFGFAGGLDGHNIKSSKFEGNIWSTTFSGHAKTLDCYSLTQDQPSMQNIFRDKQVLGFRTAYDWTISSQIGFEGQYVSDVQINECVNAFKLTNPVYRTIDWKFERLEIECEGTAFNLENARDVFIQSIYFISLGTGTVSKGNRFSNIQALTITGLNSNIIANDYTRYMEFEDCEGVRFSNNFFNDFKNTTATYIWFQGTNVDVVEKGTEFKVSAGATIAGATSGLSLEYLALRAGGTVDRQGKYTITGQVTATTDANGMISVGLPTNPDGSPLFSAFPLVFLSAGDRNFGGTDTFGPVRPGTNTTLEIITFNPATGLPRAGILRQINYMLVGN